MSNRAFIFDMDGVIVNSEVLWVKYEGNFLEKKFGKDIAEKIGNTVGMSVRSVYEKAKSLGITLSLKEFQNIYDETAFKVYDIAEITPELDTLVNFLNNNNFQIGLVSSSSPDWINKVLPKLSFTFKKIISLNDRTDLLPKPNPDGYIEMMEQLGSSADTTIILEDSNSGITSAKASGAFTIAFTQNLIDGYKQIEADAKAHSMVDVISIVKSQINV